MLFGFKNMWCCVRVIGSGGRTFVEKRIKTVSQTARKLATSQGVHLLVKSEKNKGMGACSEIF